MDSSDLGGKAGKYRMDQKKIDRINELSRKARSPEGLTQWEEQERAALRREYAVKQLSRGGKLALIARAMAQQAKILLMDEPTASLDYGNQFRLLRQVRQLADSGYTVLLSTHNPEHAFRFATDVLVLREGGVRAFGPAAETLTEELLREIYRIPLTVADIPVPGGSVKGCVYDA